MPRPKPPPTPAGSTDLTASELKHSQATDMESIFALPPPAMRSEIPPRPYTAKSPETRERSGGVLTQGSPPISPQDKPLNGSPRPKRTASGAVKGVVDNKSANADPENAYELPPPPSRARKIIQMKPKGPTTHKSSPASDADYVPPGTSVTTSTTAPPSSNKATVAASSATAASTTPSSKRKQPSASSAAGRKIARKTAHSIIERRRRSKMNEEFGVLKDMIPACEGVEMHKLAILQAGIEYLRYLEGCVSQLKAENAKLGGKMRSPSDSRMQIDHAQVDEDFDDEEEEDEQDDDDEQDDFVDDVPEAAAPPAKLRSHRHGTSGANEWTLRDSRKSSVASFSGSSAHPSPYLHSQQDDRIGTKRRSVLPGRGPSYTASPPLAGMVSSTTPTPTLLSPAFNSIHFSPELARTQTNSSVGQSTSGSLSTGGSSWRSVNHPGSATGSISNPSPGMQPLPSPKAALGLPLAQPPVTSLQLPPQYNAAVQRERDFSNRSPSAVSDASGNAEATASAALMMLTNEWRGGGRPDHVGVPPHGAIGGRRDEKEHTGKGMSVRDLLSS
ncbi:hypothetical protein H2200_007835 [Cladophialophora chaetospira]|uniref:BHLH domain-containing protein n=1 Tax=Cladophialophora chaetospira TaxID=386627 RepID=A0AA38X6I3_9EURO|nr:hypothetical protein H2200_007835 [Cladophialophora chaetospira]